MRLGHVDCNRVSRRLGRPGYRTWAEVDEPGNVEEDLVLEATEPFIGALSMDGRTLRLVEVDDDGLMFVSRVGDDALEFTDMEAAPHPIVYTAIFRLLE